jgi:hypothetical protein
LTGRTTDQPTDRPAPPIGTDRADTYIDTQRRAT